MARAAETGGDVMVAYLSDGSRSHPGSRRFPPFRVAQLREAEARDSLRVLGIAREPHFFRLPDGELSTLGDGVRSEIVARLAVLFEAFAPDMLLAPWQRDPHPDHVGAARIAADAARTSAGAIRQAGYEVWLSVRGTTADRPRAAQTQSFVVELDEGIQKRKREAILAHRSQTSDLIDDDPDGFRIDEALLAHWVGPIERFHADRVP